MATIANLAVMLSANTSKFDRGMRKSSKTLVSFNKLVGLAGAVVSVSLVKKQLDAIDSLGKTSDKLGIASEKLAGLRLAAELTGVATTAMDKGLEKLSLNLSDATNNTGEAKNAFRELGLNTAELMAMPLGKQFETIADSMNKVENQADKVRLAYRLFGRGGVGLINTLKLGSEGLKDVQKQAERMGIALSRADISKVEKLNDSMTILQSAFEGVLNEVIMLLADNADSVVSAFTEMVVVIREVTKAIGPFVSAGAKVIGWLAKLQANHTKFMTDALKALGLAESDVSIATRKAAAAAEASRMRQVKASQSALDAQRKVLDGLEQEIALFGKSANEIKLYKLEMMGAGEATMQEAASLIDQLDALKASVKAKEDAARASEELARSEKVAAEEMESLAESIRADIATPMQIYEERISTLNKVLASGKITWAEYGAAVGKARKQLEGLAKASNKAVGKSPSLVKFGTQEAIRLQRESANNADNKVVKNQEKDLQIQRQQLQALREVRNLVGSDVQITIASF